MSKKLVNKDSIVSIRVKGEFLMENYKFYPEKIYKIPFTDIVLSYDQACWARNGRNSFITYSDDELENYIVRNDMLFRKPYVKITFNSGWRDDVTKYFTTIEEANKWVENNFNNIRFLVIRE